jgi:hypothetical protein
MSAHTPGPWVMEWIPETSRRDPDLQLPDGCEFWVASDDGRGGEVLALVRPTSFKGSANGNARLIASSPELLAALKVAVETIRIWHGFGHATDEAEVWALYQESPEMQVITAALQKAEGIS